MTDAEYQLRLGYIHEEAPENAPETGFRGLNIPENVDWRDSVNGVTTTKDQGACGSCWSFAATAALEGRWNLKYGTDLDLSEQQFVDCDTDKHYVILQNKGCFGGIMWVAYNWFAQNNDLVTEEDYPYDAEDLTCRTPATDSGVRTSGYSFTGLGDCNALIEAVAEGPVAVALQANQDSFRFWAKGSEPLTAETCSGAALDHGVTVVGYRTAEVNGETVQVGLVKNSWGTRWGDAGYLEVVLNDDACGICTQGTIPLL